MRRFMLIRTEEDGVVEKGEVAEGVVFSFGRTILCWIVAPRSYTVYDSFADMVSVQAKNGKTHIQWVDTTVEPGGGVHIRSTGSQALAEALKALGSLDISEETMDTEDRHLKGATLDLTLKRESSTML